MAYIYDLTDTWNAGGTTFYGIRLNVTNSASAAGSKLISLQVGGSELFGVDKDGRVGVGTSSPSCLLDVNSNKFRVRTAKTPSSASGTGDAGDICWDASYIYVCTATNTWKRAAISTW